MSPTIASLGLDKLSREERIALVEQLIDSIEAERLPAQLSEAQRQELDRRIAEDDAKPDDVVSWEQVKAEARARYLS